MTQFHQFFLSIKQKDQQTFDLFPAEIKSFSKKCYLEFKKKSSQPSVSKLQKSVANVVRLIGVPIKEDEVLSQTGYSVDMVIDKDRKIAIEVDGPSHFNKKLNGKNEIS